MLTKDVYDIQAKNRKNYTGGREFFCYIHFIEGSKAYCFLSSLLKLLNVIGIDNLRKNGLVNIMKLE